MSLRPNAPALVLAVLLAGCASPPPVVAPPPAFEPPAAWSSTLPEAGGWRGFGDPLLAALVDEALAANLDLKSASATLAQARAQRDIVAAGQSLQVGSSASAGRSRSANRYATSLQGGLDASWEADLFGALSNASAAAQASAEASAASLAATRLAVAGETAIAYLQWQGARLALAIASDSARSQAETLQIVQWRVTAGLANALDAEQARGTLEQTRARLPALQASITQGEHQIAVLTGRAPAALATRLAAALAALPAAPSLPAPGLPAELLRRRPDVAAAEARVAAELATLAAREADLRPTFTISGNLGVAAATVASLGSSAALAAGITAAVRWPLADGGAAKARVAAQQAALDGAQAAYGAAVLAALQDVEDNLVALATGRDKAAALERAAAAADSALDIAQLRYRSGLVDFTTLLDTQRTALSAHDSLASARTDLLLTHVRLAKALGGRWPDATPS